MSINVVKMMEFGWRNCEKFGPNMVKTCNIQTPKLPQLIPPIKNCFSQGSTDNNVLNSDQATTA